MRDRRTDRRTDGWTEWNQYTPTILLCRGIIKKIFLTRGWQFMSDDIVFVMVVQYPFNWNVPKKLSITIYNMACLRKLLSNINFSKSFNSLAPGKFEWNFRHFQTDFSDWWLRHLLRNCPDMNVTGLHWWSVNIGSGNGLVPSGNKPLPEPMLTQINVAIWRH